MGMKTRFFVGAVGLAVALVVMAIIVRVRLAASGLPDLLTSGVPAAQVAAPEPAKDGALPVLADAMPEFKDVTAWLNSKPLTPESLKGKVVLVDFWTYSCINCIRTLPYVTSWYAKYRDRGFVVIGVHTPEFAFEKDRPNVEDALNRYGIAYPVAMDNAYGTWNAYANQYWPAHYLFDAKGRLRDTHFGEGAYDESENAIKALLAEAGKNAADADTAMPTTVDFAKINSPETYVGYERGTALESPEQEKHDAIETYTIPQQPTLNAFSLSGAWRVEAQRAVLVNAPGSIAYRFDAGNANLVMGVSGKPVKAVVTLDGKPVPPDLRGADVHEVNGQTVVTVDGQRLYALVDGKGAYGKHLLLITFQGAGVECYAFTFG
jgi:thiol-disulfide isomerase/thioredoxin